MNAPKQNGVDYLTCPTYDQPWTWVQVAPFIVFFVCVVVLVVACTWIYWHHNRRNAR